jgi:hypothetical protein
MDTLDKAREVWLLLLQAEQLVINDPHFHPSIINNIGNCMTQVECLKQELGDE